MSGYADAAALLFGSRKFSAREFALRTANPRAAKILSELKRRGLVARTGRGLYRNLSPDERPDPRAREWARARRLVVTAGLPMAWDGSSAVEAWTGGSYVVSPSVLTREFHIVVPKPALRAWKNYLAGHGLLASPRRRMGARVLLRAVARMPPVTTLAGELVIARADALRVVRANPALYAGAEVWFVARPG
jgi:hypothetical protein